MTEPVKKMSTPGSKDVSRKNSQNDPYAYLDRDGFSSEKYKIEIRGMPKYYGIGEFKKLLTVKLGVNLCKVKPPRRGSGWLYVCFRSIEHRDQAISLLNGILWKNSRLTAHVCIILLLLGID